MAGRYEDSAFVNERNIQERHFLMAIPSAFQLGIESKSSYFKSRVFPGQGSMIDE